MVDAPGDPRRESTGSRSLRPHEDGPPTGRLRLFYAVASAAASHPAGAIGGRSGQHDTRRRVFRTAHRLCQLIPLALYSLPSVPVRCCLNPRNSGRSPPRDQGDPSPWCVSRETHHAKGAVLRYLPRSSSFAARPAPHLCKPGYLAARIRICGDFTGFNLYIDITPYL